MTPDRETAHQEAGDGVTRTVKEVRQGVTSGHLRWVLVVSLTLGVVALGAAWLVFIAAHPH
jgi:hypothetical protein